MSKKLTIVDIAKLSGVGKSTVSRVLTNDPKVKPETRLKVEQVIDAHGYVPSKSAQSMRGGSQKVVGVIISRLDSASENRVVSAMLATLYGAGYDVVIMESQFDSVKTNEHLDVLKRRNVDGVVVFGFTGCDVVKLESWQQRMVVVAMDTENVSSINYDNQALINNALEHLRGQGLHDIAYVGVDQSDTTTGRLRLLAYLEWCERNKVNSQAVTGELSHESAYTLLDQVLTDETQAVVCASDTLALGVIKRLQELGRTEVRVTGVGGNPLLSFLFPNIFSIDPGYHQAGEKAATLLIQQLSGQCSVQHITQKPVI
ncbi:trehalose operon repressor TreR [Vibrio tapetis]|uniref:DNA-binding transcriptional repressor n=1 Tax=Vibrio tapetis subsp. tapetis TaxID=1671868 RepID=A0A2N8ZC06_9VIBR|nr:trehalose operon repressor TreR [Vibrio tapetis]SON49432.1 DNA-binding transcriptional repressor [Vibrio tapetis subsp. tapetis]